MTLDGACVRLRLLGLAREPSVTIPEYRGLVAATYDLFGGETNDDELAFYRRRIAEFGEPALEVACGTGRLLLEYLAGGIDIDGVDNAPEMLERCRAKATRRGLNVDERVSVADMRSFAARRHYRTILVPSSSFQLLTKREDCDRALHSFRRHLVAGGGIVISLADLTPNVRVAARQAQWRVRAEDVGGDGRRYRVWGRTTFDHGAGIDHDEERYEELVDGAVVRTEAHASHMRSYTTASARELLATAGFMDVADYDRFTDEPASDAARVFHVAGRVFR